MIFQRFTLLLALAVASTQAEDVPILCCKDTTEILCSEDRFSILCDAIKAVGLDEALNTGHWTVFAPTDEAVTKLGCRAEVVLGDMALLKDILLFHVVDDVVSSEDLVCGGRVEMANGQDSRTVCERQKVYQKGGTNPRNDMPQIIQADVATCQGFIHVVDEVLSPGRISAPQPPPTPECQSIADIACSLPEFSTLCTAVGLAGFGDDLSGGEWTIFAPTNEAFEKLGDALDAVLADVELLKYVLLFHAVDKVLFAEDLECTHTLGMLNGDKSRTVCMGAHIYQKGGSNPRSDMPKIINADIGSCNGVVHVIDEVMLP